MSEPKVPTGDDALRQFIRDACDDARMDERAKLQADFFREDYGHCQICGNGLHDRRAVAEAVREACAAECNFRSGCGCGERVARLDLTALIEGGDA